MSNNIVPIGQTNSLKPSNSAFKQQKLSAWQPILTVGTALPTFFLIGVAFIPVGIGLLISSYQVQEYEIDYTSCLKSDNVTRCSEFIAKHPNENCNCTIKIHLKNDFKRDVFVYYGLTNFYQNHRRYVKSRDDYQLLGNIHSNGKDCAPFQNRIDPADNVLKPIVPCGAIANSLFNDTFHLEQISGNPVPLLRTGIAWATDHNRFQNPKTIGPTFNDLANAFNGTIRPFNWRKNVYELDTKLISNDGLQNEAFIVWMRTAAFPTFRKLYARIRHDISDFQEGLPSGDYKLTIEYKFPVAGFKGKKRFIISNTSWLGGRNPFIGAVYILVGLTALILSGLFLVINKKFGSSSVDNLNITSQTPYMN